MKKVSLLTAALIGLGLVSQASADQVVYVTGSTAFRSSAYTALTTAGRIFDGAVTEAERGGSSASGANYMIFHGNINGTATYIDCAWSGSNAGIASVANVSIDNDGIPLFGAPEVWCKADGTVTGYLAAQPTSAELEASTHQGDIALSDTSQASSLPISQYVAGTSTALKSYGPIGVVTFTWLKNNNSASTANAAKTAWTNLKNISTYQEQALFGVGSLPADFFTGVAADNGTTAYLVGRNKGSGTRANVLDNSTYGVNTPVTQYSIGGNLTGTPDGTLTLAPAFDGSGVTADNGYESGGAVTTALGVAGSTAATDPYTSASGWIAIGYAGISDAQKNGVTTANWLTENGVMASNGSIETGQYSYWGYENLYGRSNISGTFADTVGGKIFSGIQASIAGNGTVAANIDPALPLNRMNASKSTDFSYPTHN